MVMRVLEPLWHTLLGVDGWSLSMSGVILNAPGSENQSWHRDGGHLFPGRDLPPHALVVFIPLVPFTEENGPTHFKPGSHKQEHKPDAMSIDPVTLWPDVGSVTIWDYRLLHRGRENVSAVARPAVYFSVTKPWFKDTVNAFPECSIFDESRNRVQATQVHLSKAAMGRFMRLLMERYPTLRAGQRKQQEEDPGSHAKGSFVDTNAAPVPANPEQP